MVEIKAKSVGEFLALVSPLNERFGTKPFMEYVFRGQANAAWPLLPKAFRKDVQTPSHGQLVRGTKYSFREQRELEWGMLRDFVLEMNRNGHSVIDEKLFFKLADDHSMLAESDRIGRFESGWPSTDHYSLLSLAQHYGLPTRLMDWSSNPYVAAYFAASDCARMAGDGKRRAPLAVYALNVKSTLLEPPSKVEQTLGMFGSLSRIPKTTYHVIAVPTQPNRNLFAQKGLFVCCTEYGEIKNEPFKPISLNAYLEARDMSRRAPDGSYRDLAGVLANHDGVTLYKFTLPSRHSHTLLAALDKLDVNASSIFPSIEGCVETLFERCRVAEAEAARLYAGKPFLDSTAPLARGKKRTQSQPAQAANPAQADA